MNESWFRLRDDNGWKQGVWSATRPSNFEPQMKIYDWYISQGIEPVVVDAEDVVERPEMTAKLCEILGMDAGGVKTEWDTVPEATQLKFSQRRRQFLSTIMDSTGVIKNKSSKGLDMMKKREQWMEEFGIAEAEWLFRKTEEAMADYEFLRNVRIV